jgi:hypothetical protein
MRVHLSPIELASLVLIAAFAACTWMLSASAGNPLLAVLLGLLCLLSGGILAYRTKRWVLCVAATLLLLTSMTVTYYYVIVPHVVFKIHARAHPGHMVVEFHEGCRDATRGIFPRTIEYVVSASGYGCSSTHRPASWQHVRLVFYDDDPNVTREPPALAEGTFLATGALNCNGSSRPYVHKDLAAPGGSRETWYDFVERVNFKCGVEPSNIAVQRTGARDARPGR